MIEDTVISSYFPVYNNNGLIFNNLIAGSIIKAVVLEIYNENILLKLPDSTLLKARISFFNDIDTNETLDLDTDIANKRTLKGINSLKSSFKVGEILELKVIKSASGSILLKNMNTNSTTNSADTYSSSGNSKNNTANSPGNSPKDNNIANNSSTSNSSINNSSVNSSATSSSAINNSPVSSNATNSSLTSSRLTDSSSTNSSSTNSSIDYVNITSKDSPDNNTYSNNILKIISANTERLHTQYEGDIAKTVAETLEPKSADYTNNIENENQGENRNNSIKNKNIQGYETQDKEFHGKEYYNKAFFTKAVTKNELLNKDTMYEIMKTLNSLKKIDTTKILNSIKSIGAKLSDTGKSIGTRLPDTDNSMLVQDKSNDDYALNTPNKNMSNRLIYFEIPVCYEGQKSSGKLYYIRRNLSNNKQNKRINNEPFTACLLLDYQNLGMMQTMIFLKQKSIYIDIKVENQHIANFIRTNFSELYSGLKSEGYLLINLKCGLLRADTKHANSIEENIEKELYNYHTNIDSNIDFRI